MASSQVTLQALLDELQAAEEAGAHALALWIQRCADPHLRGGLRVIRARDLAHARLARRRLAALGASGEGRPPHQVQTLCGVLAAPDVSDRSKLAILVSRFPARRDDRLPQTVSALADDETRALLETLHDDDRVSLRWLREASEAPPHEERGAAPPATAVRFLDALRAAETANAEVADSWRVVCTLPGLRGGLETIAEREATHASLLAERLHELGGAATAKVSDEVLVAARDRFGSPDVPDEQKLADLTARYADDAAVSGPVHAVADALEDAETREMLRLVAAGDVATFAWMRSYHRAVTGPPREASLRVLR